MFRRSIETLSLELLVDGSAAHYSLCSNSNDGSGEQYKVLKAARLGRSRRLKRCGASWSKHTLVAHLSRNAFGLPILF